MFFLENSFAAVAGRTDQGPIRKENQDDFGVAEWPDGKGLVLIVADGMGGHVGGAMASRLTISTFRSLVTGPFPPTSKARHDLLSDGFYQAQDLLRKTGERESSLADMGATAVSTILTPTECLFLHAGDCRLYHFRKGAPIFRTDDHSMVQMLVNAGQITEEQAKTHPMRSRVTSAVGANPGLRMRVDPAWEDGATEQPSIRQLQSNDVILLCSDGLSNYLQKDQFLSLVGGYLDCPEALVEACIAVAIAEGGSDNLTALAAVLK